MRAESFLSSPTSVRLSLNGTDHYLTDAQLDELVSVAVEAKQKLKKVATVLEGLDEAEQLAFEVTDPHRRLEFLQRLAQAKRDHDHAVTGR